MEEATPFQVRRFAPLAQGDGRMADNIVFFGRVLRKAGVKIGPGAIAEAVEAVGAIGIGSKEEFRAALHCVLIKRHEDTAVFDEAFAIFWRTRDYINKMLAMMSPSSPVRQERQPPKPASARVADALQVIQNKRQEERKDEGTEITTDARFTVSDREVLRSMDFAQMSAAELAAARREMDRLMVEIERVPTRRYIADPSGARIDARATLRASLRLGGELVAPHRKQRRREHPPLVVLADISGSMSQYSRIFLHFLHVLTERRRRVHTFLFGTRLTNITRQLRHRDPDEALDACAAAVPDWSGGTRIGDTLKEFNRLWARRVLGQGAVVLIITDGLEREGTALLSHEMDRLHRSCRHLVWLNPLLRFGGFEAKAQGIRAMLPHVDEFRPVHNLESLASLARALSSRGGDDRRMDPRRYLREVSHADPT